VSRDFAELSISLDMLRYNVEKIREITGENDFIFMAKANAYGHGMCEIVHFAFYELKVKRFGVATLPEAIEVRKMFLNDQVIGPTIYAFSEVGLAFAEDDSVLRTYAEWGVVPVLSHINDVRFILEKQHIMHLPLVLKLNTGMNRLGVAVDPSIDEENNLDELLKVFKKYNVTKVDHLMTHFSDTSTYWQENPLLQQQIKSFFEAYKKIQKNGVCIPEFSLFNSGGIHQYQFSQLNMKESFSLKEFVSQQMENNGIESKQIFRPGISLYGPHADFNACEKIRPWEFKNISSLKVHPLAIRKVEKDECIGYGPWKVPRAGYLIIIPLGYGDGLFRSLSCEDGGVKWNSVETFFKDPDCRDNLLQIIGRVNMDLTYILLPEKYEQDDFSKKAFMLWDKGTYGNYVLNTWSKFLNTIPYEILTHLGQRIPRVFYKEQGSDRVSMEESL